MRWRTDGVLTRIRRKYSEKEKQKQETDLNAVDRLSHEHVSLTVLSFMWLEFLSITNISGNTQDTVNTAVMQDKTRSAKHGEIYRRPSELIGVARIFPTGGALSFSLDDLFSS